MSQRIYLDYNATAPVRPEVCDAMASAYRETGNASSVHAEGRRARDLIETARDRVAGLVGAHPANIVFTSGGTEANVTALAPENAVTGEGPRGNCVCFTSSIEHPSVLAGGRFEPRALRRAPVTSGGTLDLAAFARALSSYRAQQPEARLMVSVMLANNETGAIQPLAEIAGITREHGGVVHTDAVQAAGKIPLDAGRLGVDLMSLSAHKIGGPQGVGALVLGMNGSHPRGVLLRGGDQERRRRAGTENVPGIVGFGVAAEIAQRELARIQGLARLRDEMERQLSDVASELVVFARDTQRLANTSCFAVPATRAETIVIALDLVGCAVSAGSACSSGKVERSHVLEAMGAAPDLAASAIRVSLGWRTSQEDVERFIAAWSRIYEELGRRRAAA